MRDKLKLGKNKFKFDIKLFSIGFNVVLLTLLVVIVGILYKFRIIPPFSNTYDTVEDSSQIDLKANQVDILAQNLEIPWAIAQLDNGSYLVSERTGSIRLIDSEGNLQSEPVVTFDDVVAVGEAGLMSIAIDPDFTTGELFSESNRFIYVYRTYGSSSDVKLKVSRYTFENNQFVDEYVLIDDIPAGSVHSGGEIAFGPDEKLYITTGDIGNANLAQDTLSIAGKTLRLEKDGSVPSDNPYVGRINVDNRIWSLGHRNAQGLDWHPVTDEMYQSEHGPSGFDGGTGMDEINRVVRGGNYGWPTIRGSETNQGMYSPLIEYSPAIAPGSVVFYNGNLFPELKNKLLVATLRGQTILVISTDNNKVEQIGTLVDSSFGRIRDLFVNSDGEILFTTSNTDGRGTERDMDDKIYKITSLE